MGSLLIAQMHFSGAGNYFLVHAYKPSVGAQMEGLKLLKVELQASGITLHGFCLFELWGSPYTHHHGCEARPAGRGLLKSPDCLKRC